MKMTELMRYDVPAEVIALWRERESDTLLPLQEMAVKRHRLFEAGNRLIQAPTSSGKTFIGEMAAIQTAMRRKKVVYLVPLKALAEEKYHDFREKYEDYGLKVIVSSRDRREFDRDLESGDFSIAVVVYEKLAQLLVRRPERLEEIDLIIADELEILSDPERGAVVEILMTRILQSQCRLIGLSAVIGEAERLAGWMRADLVGYERRPVELRYGVLHEGTFRYRTYNDYGEGEETLVDAQSESTWEAVSQNACAFVERGETCLIFVKAKHESRRGAELLKDRLDEPPATEAVDALRTLEPTRSRDALIECLNHGVAFHNADLSQEERGIVEEAFRQGAVKLMVSTSTLAVGLNMPARNVFLTPEKWRYDQRLDMPWKTPILHTEYENMGGRAGRYGAGHDFGRSILVATTPFDFETLWRRYVQGEREGIEPRLAKEPLENHVLRLVASRFCRTITELLAFLESTLTGQWIWAETFTLEEIESRIRAAVNRCVDAGVVTSNEDGRLEATPLGLAVASKGICIATARELEHWIGESETRDWADIDLIFAAASTPDGRMFQVMLTAKEYEHADYAGCMKRHTADCDVVADTPLNRVRNCALTPFFEEVRAIKIALFLERWINQAPVHDIEEEFHTMSGQIVSAADQASWLLDATAAIASALGGRKQFIDRMQALSDRLQFGVLEESLPLARQRLERGRRNVVLEMTRAGLHTPAALAEATESQLRPWLKPAAARALQAWARAQCGVREAATVQTSNPAPVLVVDDRQPDRIEIDGKTITLQDKQYCLIRLLAATPGQCVPYDTIYDTLWGDTVVENNQMHYQKQNLLKRIRAAVPDRAGMVRTVPKRGFVLELSEDEVRCPREAAMSSAA